MLSGLTRAFDTRQPLGRCRATEKMLRSWSQQVQQLTPRRGTVAHPGNLGCCVDIHTGNLSLPRSCTTHAYSRLNHIYTGNLSRVLTDTYAPSPRVSFSC